MTREECIPFIENIPAYALGALDADEAAALEAHLQTCESCPAELADYRAVSEALLMTTPPQRPPAALRKKLQGRLPGAQKVNQSRRIWSFTQFAMGAALILLIGLNIFSMLQIRTLQSQQAALARQIETGQTALAMLAYPGTQNLPINAQGVAGSLLLEKDRNAAVLIIWNLPPIAEDQTYQMWLIKSNQDRVSAGLFRPEPGQPFTSASLISTQDFSNFIGLGVTVEPAGGSDHPTGPRLFKIDF
jgi:anti-sigma-K factor RskA